MPRLDPIGRVDNPDDLDFEPLTIPVVGYDRDKNERLIDVEFRGVMPTGSALDIMRHTNPETGTVNTRLVMAYLDEAVEPESRDAWAAFLHDPDVFVEQTTLMEVYQSLVAFYAARPTKQRSDSRGGTGPAKRTSRAAASGRASTSSRSRSVKR